MRLYHASKLLYLRPPVVVPLNYYHPDNGEELVHFHETRAGAEQWVANRIAGWALYEIDGEAIPGLRPGKWPRHWVTDQPVPTSFFDLVAQFNEDAGEIANVVKAVQNRLLELSEQ